jgi:hypothetical protein
MVGQADAGQARADDHDIDICRGGVHVRSLSVGG